MRYYIENDAIETARKSAEDAREEMRKAIETGKDIKAAIGRWRIANDAYLTVLRTRYNF